MNTFKNCEYMKVGEKVEKIVSEMNENIMY